MGVQGTRLAFVLLLVLSFVFSFLILFPKVEKVMLNFCESTFKSKYCYHFIGVEAAYRLTLCNFEYHWIIIGWYFAKHAFCASCEPGCNVGSCLLAVVAFPAVLVCCIVIPSSILFFETLYYIFFLNSLMFIMIGFKITLNFAWSWRVYIVDESLQLRNKPTCYVCTWLFFLHLTSSVLYALSLDIILAFFFFNDIHQCGTTILFLIINLILCITAAVLSFLPPLKTLRASSHIIISMMTFYVMFATWIALSDPENENCNLYGTVFSGAHQDSSFNTRSVTGLTINIFFLIVSCFKNQRETFISHVTMENSGINTELNTMSYPFTFHFVLATSASFTLMSFTNWYMPHHETSAMITTINGIKKLYRARWILRENNWLRFLLLCITSTLLPLAYIVLLVCYICRLFLFPEPKSGQRSESEKEGSLSSLQIPPITKVTFTESVEMLKKTPSLKTSEDTQHNIEHIYLTCFSMEGIGVRYWHFPRHISQAYYGGRNGSNACTLIAIVIGRLFSRSSMRYSDKGFLPQNWIQLFVSSIAEGNELYDEIVKKYGVLDLSIEEAVEAFGNRLNVKRVEHSLPVSFESETVTATVLYQLSGIVSLSSKQVALFIHKQRTGAFLVYPDRAVIFVDSHAYGDKGAILVWSSYENIRHFVEFLKEILGGNGNRLSTLTVVKYETRSNILPSF